MGLPATRERCLRPPRLDRSVTPNTALAGSVTDHRWPCPPWPGALAQWRLTDRTLNDAVARKTGGDPAGARVIAPEE